MIPVINPTPNLSDCRDKWFFDAHYDCWCLEDVLYTPLAERVFLINPICKSGL